MKTLRNLFIEIKQDKCLSLYGIPLSLAYILTIFFWYQTGGAHFASTDEPWCWPFYPQCWQYRITFAHAISFFALIALFASLSLVNFVYNRIDKACWLLFLTWFFTFLLVVQDFRFRSNQFYMLSWVTLIYLFSPSKKASISAIIIAFYFWAGRLKLNWEWISGSGLYNKLWLIPDSFVVLACCYVIVLEMILIWGLVSRRKWIFWTTFIQLILFHLQSFSQVSYWYPWLMFLLLSFFILDRKITPDYTKSASFNVVSWSRCTWIIFAIFSLLQLNPIVYSETPLRVSSWRFLALHMLEARYICDTKLEKSVKNLPLQVETVDIPLAPRMKCDPIIYWNYARNRCREWGNDPLFIGLEMKIKYRKSSDYIWKSLSMSCDKEQNL